MRREDLTGSLRQAFTPERGFGVARVARPGYENIWFVVPPAPPVAIPPGLPAEAIASANRILLARPHLDAGSQLERLTALLFATREAVSSSRMEGTWSTVDHLLTPTEVYDLEEGRSAHMAVRGYALAIHQGLDEVRRRGLDAMTVPLVCRLHELMMSKDPSFLGVGGRLRTPGLPGDVVQIGALGRKEESIFNPAPPEEVARCLDAVMTWLRDRTLVELGDAGMGLSLPVRLAIGHAHFEAVHPFSDGNGRVGRLLWPLQMAAAGLLPLYISGYVEQQRDVYRRALEAAQKQLRYAEIVDFVAKAIVASHEEETLSKAAIEALPETWQARGRFRRDSSAQRALSLLICKPIVTTRSLARDLEVSVQAATSALNDLVHCGIVRERTGKGRNRVFAAEEVIAILSRPFGEDPEIAMEGARRALDGGRAP